MRVGAVMRAFLVLAMAVVPLGAQPKAGGYVPPRGTWETRAPSAMGMDAAWLDSARAFHVRAEAKAPRDLEQAHYQTFGREPFGEAVGPFATRGDPTGLVIKGGYVVAQWGDPARVDQTFSVTKSFVSTVVGLAVDRGLVRSVHDTVSQAVGPVYALRFGPRGDRADGLATRGEWIEPFGSSHNRRLTWDHLLRQTSDWEGTLWGKPEWADRPSGEPATWRTRPRAEPGTTYEYNDVRVNALALAATNVWRRPLPQVLRELVMDPIGASPTWRWLGYDTSWIVLDGTAVQSVAGGGHWGGGMFISAWDMARFGLLTLRRGMWGTQRILSDAWVAYATTPTPVQRNYGVMNWFLNVDGTQVPSAPRQAFVHLGNGTNLVYVDPVHDLVVVARWIESREVDPFIARVLRAVAAPGK